jgi:hypothetical protein
MTRREQIPSQNKRFADLGSFKTHVILDKREFVCAFSGDRIRQRSGPNARLVALSAVASCFWNL